LYRTSLKSPGSPSKTNKQIKVLIDFHRLIYEILSITWPMTSINKALERIGTHKPEYFAKLDMTLGYHQKYGS